MAAATLRSKDRGKFTHGLKTNPRSYVRQPRQHQIKPTVGLSPLVFVDNLSSQSYGQRFSLELMQLSRPSPGRPVSQPGMTERALIGSNSLIITTFSVVTVSTLSLAKMVRQVTQRPG